MLRRLRIENLVLIREAELDLAPGLNAITGETGAGKTILSQAIGLLLGARGDAALIGAEGQEAYIEAELDTPGDLLEEDGLEAVAELRPEDEEGVAVARRVFADGRTRAYAWGRSAAREDVAALAERLIAMSGQFEQRRLARPAYQLDVLDTFCGEEQIERRATLRRAWRELQVARRAHEELSGNAVQAKERIAMLRALVEDTAGVDPVVEEELRQERERLRHMTELAAAASAAAAALAPDDGDGAVALTARAGHELGSVSGIAAELAPVSAELRECEVRLAEAASAIRAFLASLDADPGRLEHVEAELERYADLRRAYRAETTASSSSAQPLPGSSSTRSTPASIRSKPRPERSGHRSATSRGSSRRSASRAAITSRGSRPPSQRSSAGSAWGRASSRWSCRNGKPSSTGRDDVRFLVRPNAGLPLAPVSETASGGELSRIALAIAAVGGGETMVFDEIDAGVGGETAHAVADTLVRLADTGAGRHDHPSAADREPRGAALRRREGAGRSDAHAHSRADAGRAA